MLLFCPYFHVKWCCIITILYIVLAYYLFTFIVDYNVSLQYNIIKSINFSNKNAIREKTNTWIDLYKQIKEATNCKDNDPTSMINSAIGKILICCLCLFGMSLFICMILVLWLNSRKKIKLEKCEHIVVEKVCGCKIGYDPTEVP